MGRAKRIWYLSPMRAAKVQASLRIRAVSPEPPLLAHTSSESWGTFRQKARSLASLNGWACAVKTCHDGMLEDTNSLDSAHIKESTRLNDLNVNDVHSALCFDYSNVLRLSFNFIRYIIVHPPSYYIPSYVSPLINIILNTVPYISFRSLSFCESHVHSDMSHVMKKPVYAICEQQRRRSACASTQSDLRLGFSLPW